MGAIQNSLNQITNAIGSAVKTGAVVAEYGAHQAEQHDLAKQQYHEASADLKQLEGEKENAAEALAKANEAAEATKNWNMEGANKALLEGKAQKRLSEKEAAQRAFDELQDRIEAKLAMQSRAEKIMKKTSSWGGVR